ncbi:hypothetical protein [Yersinia proxima]|uniref:hypothetical protein n=1 Tax=Yersinia proxima TaxID=2890316 RepID=UPI001D102E6E|nr:hypothetical protein [Yersinia proxima]
MMTIKFVYKEAEERTHEAIEVRLSKSGSLHVTRPDKTTDIVELSQGDVAYLENDSGKTVARYFGKPLPEFN